MGFAALNSHSSCSRLAGHVDNTSEHRDAPVHRCTFQTANPFLPRTQWPSGFPDSDADLPCRCPARRKNKAALVAAHFGVVSRLGRLGTNLVSSSVTIKFSLQIKSNGDFS